MMSNASFLLGAYLIIVEKFTVEKVKKAFGQDMLTNLYPFRDAGV